MLLSDLNLWLGSLVTFMALSSVAITPWLFLPWLLWRGPIRSSAFFFTRPCHCALYVSVRFCFSFICSLFCLFSRNHIFFPVGKYSRRSSHSLAWHLIHLDYVVTIISQYISCLHRLNKARVTGVPWLTDWHQLYSLPSTCKISGCLNVNFLVNDNFAFSFL